MCPLVVVILVECCSGTGESRIRPRSRVRLDPGWLGGRRDDDRARRALDHHGAPQRRVPRGGLRADRVGRARGGAVHDQHALPRRRARRGPGRRRPRGSCARDACRPRACDSRARAPLLESLVTAGTPKASRPTLRGRRPARDPRGTPASTRRPRPRRAGNEVLQHVEVRLDRATIAPSLAADRRRGASYEGGWRTATAAPADLPLVAAAWDLLPPSPWFVHIWTGARPWRRRSSSTPATSGPLHPSRRGRHDPRRASPTRPRASGTPRAPGRQLAPDRHHHLTGARLERGVRCDTIGDAAHRSRRGDGSDLGGRAAAATRASNRRRSSVISGATDADDPRGVGVLEHLDRAVGGVAGDAERAGSATAWWWLELTRHRRRAVDARHERAGLGEGRAVLGERAGRLAVQRCRSPPTGGPGSSRPPLATAITCMPRQMPSTGRPWSRADRGRAGLGGVAVQARAVRGRACACGRTTRARRRRRPRARRRRASRGSASMLDSSVTGGITTTAAPESSSASTYARCSTTASTSHAPQPRARRSRTPRSPVACADHPRSACARSAARVSWGSDRDGRAAVAAASNWACGMTGWRGVVRWLPKVGGDVAEVRDDVHRPPRRRGRGARGRPRVGARRAGSDPGRPRGAGRACGRRVATPALRPRAVARGPRGRAALVDAGNGAGHRRAPRRGARSAGGHDARRPGRPGGASPRSRASCSSGPGRRRVHVHHAHAPHHLASSCPTSACSSPATCSATPSCPCPTATTPT